MDTRLRKAQHDVLRAFAKSPGGFALAGGTALELYYLNHRFSADLDFLSAAYDNRKIDKLAAHLGKAVRVPLNLETELTAGGRARVRFYSMAVPGSRPLKIDFVEDVLFPKPDMKKIDGVPVYAALAIYFQKITTITGTQFDEDEIGRPGIGGRREARDVFDIYMLSQKIKPLCEFLKNVPHPMQRGMARWYQTFSRQDLKLGLLDLDIYDPQFDSRGMIRYLEDQIQRFMAQELNP